MATSFDNVGGRGNRTAIILPTTSTDLFTTGTANLTKLIDGSFSSGLTLTVGKTDGFFKFDFGAGAQKIIDAFIFWSLGNSHGDWRWYGSNDDVTYTPLGNTFTLAGASGFGGTGTGVQYNEPAGNVTPYRYYRLTQESGSTLGSTVREFDFRIDNYVVPSESSSETPPSSSPSSETPVVSESFWQDPTDYSNPGGTGDRRSLIWVSPDFNPTSNAALDMSVLVNGNFSANASNARDWGGGGTDYEIVFDFGPTGYKQCIDEFKWYQSASSDQGLWNFDASDDAVTWTTLKAAFDLVTANTTTHTVINTTGYRFYRLKWVSGSTSGFPWITEIEFKLAKRTRINENLPVYQTGDRTGRIAVTFSGALNSGSPSSLVDGVTGSGTFSWVGGQSNQTLTFDFGNPTNVNEAKWRQSNTTSAHGTWKWRGSDDGVSWTDIGLEFTLCGQTFMDSALPTFRGNTQYYRYYQLFQTGGTTNATPFIYEVEFREQGAQSQLSEVPSSETPPSSSPSSETPPGSSVGSSAGSAGSSDSSVPPEPEVSHHPYIPPGPLPPVQCIVVGRGFG